MSYPLNSSVPWMKTATLSCFGGVDSTSLNNGEEGGHWVAFGAVRQTIPVDEALTFPAGIQRIPLRIRMNTVMMIRSVLFFNSHILQLDNLVCNL